MTKEERLAANEAAERKREKKERKLGLVMRRYGWLALIIIHMLVFLGVPFVVAYKVSRLLTTQRIQPHRFCPFSCVKPFV